MLAEEKNDVCVSTGSFRIFCVKGLVCETALEVQLFCVMITVPEEQLRFYFRKDFLCMILCCTAL